MPLFQHTPLILASGSAIRAQMLKSVGLQFSVVPSGVDEDALKKSTAHLPIPEQALALARAKALSVAAAYPDHLTIGADQMCALGDRIFDKPETRAGAVAQLKALRGQMHHQHSAVCVVKNKEVVWEYVTTAALTMRNLNDAEIESYITLDYPLSSCGSYKYEQHGRYLFETVEGDQDVIKGLPLQALLIKLYSIGAVTLG